MARTIVDSNLKDRTARGRLKARRKPYWREIEPNLAIGYRRLKGRKNRPAGAGTWSARHYVGGGAYTVEKIDGVADDFSDANGVTVLDFKQAQDKARALHLQRHTASEITGPLTVKAAIETHLDHLAGLGRNVFQPAAPRRCLHYSGARRPRGGEADGRATAPLPSRHRQVTTARAHQGGRPAGTPRDRRKGFRIRPPAAVVGQ